MHANMTFNATCPQQYISAETIQTWLVEQIALTTGIPADDIDIAQPFSSHGIDSVAAASLSGEFASLLGIQLAPTILWDYPCVQLLARYLASALSTPWRLAA